MTKSMNEEHKTKLIKFHVIGYLIIPLLLWILFPIIWNTSGAKEDNYYTIPAITYQADNREENLIIYYPSKNLDNFFSVKPPITYENFHDYVGRRFDINFIKDNFSFGYIICSDNMQLCQVYDRNNIKYMDISINEKGAISKILSVYLNGISIEKYPDKIFATEEILRLSKFMNSIGIIYEQNIDSSTKIFYVEDLLYRYSAIVKLVGSELHDIQSLEGLINIQSGNNLIVELSIERIYKEIDWKKGE